MTKSLAPFDRIVLLLQGGGALGSYQVGVYQALVENHYSPDWIISTSIGAINGAIIAGNSPEKRMKRLKEFWNLIATPLPAPPDVLNNILLSRWHHYISASCAQTFGQKGFFTPRWWNPYFSTESTADKLSLYDTSMLKETLLKFIDFDLLNEQKIRLSMGAVHISTGNLRYFDNTKITITPEHIMASCALPPGFPAVWVGDQLYWDGGVHSNTQINLLLLEEAPYKTLCFMVQLFDSYGCRPRNMDDVLKRLKDIQYSSRHRGFIKAYCELHGLRHAIAQLSKLIPEEQKKDPATRQLIRLGHNAILHVARFHYKGKEADLSSKDYEFSLSSIQEHISCGYDNVCDIVNRPPWHELKEEEQGIYLYEVNDPSFVEEAFVT